MTKTFTLSVKYYNSETAEDYEYTSKDTVKTFLDKHPDLENKGAHILYFGPFIYDGGSEKSIQSIVKHLNNQPVLVFPENMDIDVTHINLNNEEKRESVTVGPTQELNQVIDEVRTRFEINGNIMCKFCSDVEKNLPGYVNQFNFQATRFYIEEVSMKSII